MEDLDLSTELHHKSTIVSQIILGGQDGLVNVLGVILGVAVASGEVRIILAGGLAATFAESISMGAVAYTYRMAEKDHYLAQLAREKERISEKKQSEKEAIRDIYRKKGFSEKLTSEITDHITSNDSVWLSTIMREKLGLSPIKQRDVIEGSVVVFLSAFVGSLVPLFPFFILPLKEGLIASIIVSALTLFAIGVYKAQETTGKHVKSGLEITIIGMGAAVIGYIIGLLFKV